MSSPPDSDLFKRSADLVRCARHAVAMTGAGISTPSGIPDFRSHDSGLWNQYNPLEVASLSAFRTHPERVFEWVRPFMATIVTAEPNPAHLALARLEAAQHLAGIITQNIDDLHRRAGSRVVHEIHGHLRQATCSSCFIKVPAQELLQHFINDNVIPHCNICGGLLKPDIVLLGEQLPYLVVRAAEDLMQACDLVIVIGSSLEVTPAATIPVPALNRGAGLIIINHDPTYLDERADVVFNADVVDVLPRIAEEVVNVR